MKIRPYTFESLTEERPRGTSNASFFTEDFGAAKKEKEVLPPPPPPAPTFSEKEMEEARVTAHEEGFMEGKKEGVREAEKDHQRRLEEMTLVLSKVEQKLIAIHAEQQEKSNANSREIAQLVMACAQRVAGEALRQMPLSDIHEMIENSVAGLFDSAAVSVSVHPDIAEGLKDKLPKEISLREDQNLNPADCRIDWQHGEAVRDTQALWHALEEKIQRHFNPQSPHANEGEKS